jgi:AcrR family transcriptional regulator
MKKWLCGERNPDKARELLLQAAIQLFAESGFDGVTVRDIAQKAGVNFSMISYHFGGKEGLYRACIEEFGRTRVELSEGLIGPFSSREEFVEKLHLIIRHVLEEMGKEPELLRILSREIEAGLPIASEVFEATFLKLFASIVEFYSRAQEQGYIKKDLDPTFLMSMIHGTFMHQYKTDAIRTRYFGRSIHEASEREKVINNFTEIFLGGVLAR